MSSTLTQTVKNQNEISNLILPRDRDQDEHSIYQCANSETGGWWYHSCYEAHPTGQSSATRKNGYKFIIYHDGGERGIGKDSWAEAEYLLIPN